jgi:CRP/FNR family cyclic AMP-dependent transcriptional regulator
VLVLHLTLLPLNVWRLVQLQRLTQQIREASAHGFSFELLKPFTRQRSVKTGAVLFRQGEPATEALVVLEGRFRAVEADTPLGPGEMFGELGLVAQNHARTQTVVCEQAGTVLSLTYDEIRQLYFQNPKFGFFFLELVAARLTRDARRSAA